MQWFEQQTLRWRVKRSVVPTDPWFSKQWYMVSWLGLVAGLGHSRAPLTLAHLAQNSEVQPDLNILQVWSQGLSGQGIVVSILDDGIEKDHPDLWANYVSPWWTGAGAAPPHPIPTVPWPTPTSSHPHPTPRTLWPAMTSTTMTQTPSHDTHPVTRTGEPCVPHDLGIALVPCGGLGEL